MDGSTDDPVVGTRDGLVRGRRLMGVDRYLGIPYATAARFAVPAPPGAWDGTFDADAIGPIAPQEAGAQFQRADLAQSEDCLSVNVWTPAGAGAGDAGRPVLVWIHGGAFRQGSGASPLYDGTRLAARGDVVVITLNYRLGVLGFLGHATLGDGDDTVRANWGLLDQVEALGWVRDNAAAFGGDPGNVTIFGESAGAVSVSLLCTMAAAKGLFHKAVVQSGAPITATWAATEQLAEEVAAAAGVADVAALRTLPLQDLIAAQAQVTQGGVGRMFTPCLDGHVLSSPPLAALAAGSAAGIPMVLGTNVDEWKLFAPADPRSRTLDEDRLRLRLSRWWPAERVDTVIDVVRHARAARGEPTEPRDLFFAIESERIFRVPSLRAADAQADQAPTFVYLFGWGSPAMRGWLGACHGLEIAFVFGNQGSGELAAFTGSGPDADALGEQMMDAWIAFARTGDPSTDALPWPRHDAAARPTMVFDVGSHAERGATRGRASRGGGRRARGAPGPRLTIGNRARSAWRDPRRS